MVLRHSGQTGTTVVRQQQSRKESFRGVVRERECRALSIVRYLLLTLSRSDKQV